MNNVYKVKNLVVAMPATGKTYYARTMNQQLPRHLRPVIDFDYTGPRLSGDDALGEMLDAQTDLINSFAGLPHVHTIFVHPDAVRWENVHSLDFNVTFVLPADTKVLRAIVERCQKRDGNVQFTRDYANLAEQWWINNIRLAGKLTAWGFDVSVIELKDRGYLDEVYNPDEFHPGGRLLNCAHVFAAPKTETTAARDYTINRDWSHRELVQFLMNEIAKILQYRGKLHDADKGDRKLDCSKHHLTARHHYNHLGNVNRCEINIIDVIENICDVVATSVERGFWDPPRQSGDFYEAVMRCTMNHLRSLVVDGHDCHWFYETPDVHHIVEK